MLERNSLFKMFTGAMLYRYVNRVQFVQKYKAPQIAVQPGKSLIVGSNPGFNLNMILGLTAPYTCSSVHQYGFRLRPASLQAFPPC